jgi:hypothetical protein
MPPDNEKPESNESGNATGFVVKPTSDSHFAWIRTRLSADSTLMGWMRVATTLIGFGFAIVQFFDRLETMSSASQTCTCAPPTSLSGIGIDFFRGIRPSHRNLAICMVRELPSLGGVSASGDQAELASQ